MVSGLIQNIAGIANRSFAEFVLIEHFINCHGHTRQPIERIKDTENINAALCALFDKLTHDIVRIIGISDCIGSAQQHLERNIRNLFAQKI